MFYNIDPNAAIWLSSCPPPTNFTITDMNATQVIVSWVGYDWNNFIIRYGLEGFSNPDDGEEINVTNKINYTFTSLNSGTRYDVYLKTVCGNKASYWLGPLLVSIESYNLPHSGTDSIDTCSKVIYDSGGPNGAYKNNANSTLTIYPEFSGKLVSIKGSGGTDCFLDRLCIYDGVGTGSKKFGCYYDQFTIPLFLSSTGPLAITFTSDKSYVTSGFQLVVGCIYISQSIYGLIEGNNYQMNLKYQYRGKWYYICPYGTSNVNFTCYSNSVLEKCEEYSIESDNENLCIKCKNNYYPMLNDTNNKNNFINCYKNNSLEKYYLDNNDFLFKSCYKSCRICIQNGTTENHNFLTCDTNYEFNLTFGDYHNCYPKCDNSYYYFDNNKNFICLNKTECPIDYNNLIEEKNQCIDNCNNDPEYKFHFRKKCYKECPVGISYESEIQKYFCEIKCNKSMPFEIVEYQYCVDYCGINEMGNKTCVLKYKDNEINGNLILNYIKQDIISTNFDRSILNNDNNIIINESFISFIITNVKIQKNSENQIINLGECENILKNHYEIENDEDLIIFLIDIDKEDEGMKKLVYEVYGKTDGNILSKLDLKLCEDVLINNNNLLNSNDIIKCDNYSIDSILNDSCITCAKGYYSKYEDILNNDKYIKCYKSIEGYYLDKTKYFKKCYESRDFVRKKEMILIINV